MYHRSCQTICAGLLLPHNATPASSSPATDHMNNSTLSPFKTPLPVYSSVNNKTSHTSFLPALTSKSLFNSSPHANPDALSSPSPSPTKAALLSPTKLHPQGSYPGMAGLEFASYIHIENQPNGGALVAHAHTSQLSTLSASQRQRFAQEFVTLVFSEDSSQVQWRYSLEKKTVLIIIKNKHKIFFFSLFFIGSSLCDGNCPWRRQLPAWLFGLLLLQVSSSSGQNGNIGEEGHRDDNHGSFLLSGRSLVITPSHWWRSNLTNQVLQLPHI